MVAKLWSTLLHVIVWEILKWANTFVTYLYVYPRQGCHAPSVGRNPCVSFFVLALLGVLHTPHSHLLAGCSTYLSSWLLIAYCLMPIAYCLLPIAYCLLPIAYCLLPVAAAVTSLAKAKFDSPSVVLSTSSSRPPSLPQRIGSCPCLLPPCSPASPQFRQYVSNASPSALHARRCRLPSLRLILHLRFMVHAMPLPLRLHTLFYSSLIPARISHSAGPTWLPVSPISTSIVILGIVLRPYPVSLAALPAVFVISPASLSVGQIGRASCRER